MWLKMARRTLRSPAFWVGGLLLIGGISTNLGADESPGRPAEAEAQSSSEKILREGTRVESRPAECRSEGERLTILLPDTTRALTALENLATQRIQKAVLDDPSDKQWIITGTVTEFQGRNYILIERVSRVAKK